jgi:ArsR family transcriptional regulator
MTTTSLSTRRTKTTPVADVSVAAEECFVPPELEAAVAPPDDDTLAAMAKAIAHPARLAILRLLTDRETCVTGDVVNELPLAQSTVSEHLRILREAGLIQGEIEGPRTRYCTNATGLAALKAGIAAL